MVLSLNRMSAWSGVFLEAAAAYDKNTGAGVIRLGALQMSSPTEIAGLVVSVVSAQTSRLQVTLWDLVLPQSLSMEVLALRKLGPVMSVYFLFLPLPTLPKGKAGSETAFALLVPSVGRFIDVEGLCRTMTSSAAALTDS